MRLIRSALSNLLTILLSVALATIIWFNAVQTEDPVQTESLQIPIDMVGLPEDATLIRTGNQTVQIIFEGTSSVVSGLTVEDFVATVDLSQVPFGQETAQPVRVQYNRDDPITIRFQSPEEVVVLTERIVTREIPIRVDTRGSVARGHSQGEPLVEPPSISVAGPATRIEELEFARVTVFLDSERENVIASPQPIFYDSQGRVASVSGLDLSAERVTVTIPVDESPDFAEKFIIVDRTGEPAPGYRLLNVSVEPPSVLVRGLPTQLSRIQQLRTEPIDLTGLTESFRPQVTLVLPEGITLDEDQEIFVSFEIEPIQTTASFNRAIEVLGVGRDLSATVEPDEVRVVLTGPLPVLDSLVGEEVRVTVDAFDLMTGTHSLAPDVNFPDRGIELRSIQPELVSVTITRQLTITNEVTSTRPLTGTTSGSGAPDVENRIITVEQVPTRATTGRARQPVDFPFRTRPRSNLS